MTRSICERLREWERLETAFHDSLPNQGECGDPAHGKALCQFLYDNSAEFRTLIETQAALLVECGSLVRFFVEQGCPVCSGDCASANPMPPYCPMEDASHITRSIAKLKERRDG